MKIENIPFRVSDACFNRGFRKEQIESMTAFELFHEFCTWEGLINWSDTLWGIVQQLEQASKDDVKVKHHG